MPERTRPDKPPLQKALRAKNIDFRAGGHSVGEREKSTSLHLLSGFGPTHRGIDASDAGNHLLLEIGGADACCYGGDVTTGIEFTLCLTIAVCDQNGRMGSQGTKIVAPLEK